MKANKSPNETKVTPSKKKLKQAQLPFKILSDVSSTTIVPQTRKRKLSASETETTPKVVKIDKENDLVDVTVISDDEEQEGQQPQNEEKLMNPFVKLVDTAWKKKQQKAKGVKKKKYSKKKDPANDLVHNNETSKKELSNNCEMMDVDDPKETDNEEKSANAAKLVSETCTSDVVFIENSNDSSVGKSEFEIRNQLTEEKKTSHILHSNKKYNVSSKQINKNKLNICNTSPTKSNKSLQILDTNTEVITEEGKLETVNSILKDDIIIVEDENELESLDTSISDKGISQDAMTNEQVTPKRSTRSKSKVADSENSAVNSKLNDSSSSNASTPKENKGSVPNKDINESLNESLLSVKKLTPKQLQKKLEATKRKEEREREKQELEKKRQLEKEERARQKQEKEEQKRREKEEKEEQRKKEKEEKEKQKEFEKKLKEEKEELRKKEKEEKEDQKRKEKEAKEEEKRKRQEALELEKQEQELKKKKAAEAFANFFLPKQKSEKDQITVDSISKNDILSNFTIKADMRLAPTKRVDLNNDKIQQLDKMLLDQTYAEDKLYLKSLKSGISKPLSNGKTWPISDKDDDDDVVIVGDDLPIDGAGEITCESAPREKLRPKLFSFHENRRPPYWGTWRKKSPFIKARNPFGQDEKQLDYEVDSDDDWEEEQEGESIDGSAAGSDDEQDADEYEVDNELFVPHGYLSDEEATLGEDDVLSLTPETQKARLKYLEDEFESEMKKPTEKLKPRMYGLLWQTVDGDKPNKCVDALWEYFNKFSMIMADPTPSLQPSNELEDTEKKKVKKKKSVSTENTEQKTPKSSKKKKQTSEQKETKPLNKDVKKNVPDKKNQPSINMFLNKLKTP